MHTNLDEKSHLSSSARCYDGCMQRVPELVIGLILLTAAFEMMAQQSTTHKSSTAAEEAPVSSAEEAESYDIYSGVLQVKEPTVGDWTIVRETRAFPMCLEPARDQDSIYRPVIDDYALNNKKTVVLQRKFKLSAYTLVGPEAWGPVNTRHRTFAVFSAVGFNRDRTRALVCFWAKDSGTCSFMVKQDTRWQIDRSWRGGVCYWAY
jgi:hypothetical protein